MQFGKKEVIAHITHMVEQKVRDMEPVDLSLFHFEIQKFIDKFKETSSVFFKDS